MARQSDDKESIDRDKEKEKNYELYRALGIADHTISAAEYAVMSSSLSH